MRLRRQVQRRRNPVSPQAALNAYSRALELDPELLPCLTNRAACYLRLGEQDKCALDCTKALDLLGPAESKLLSGDAEERARLGPKQGKMIVKALLRRSTCLLALGMRVLALLDLGRAGRLQRVLGGDGKEVRPPAPPASRWKRGTRRLAPRTGGCCPGLGTRRDDPRGLCRAEGQGVRPLPWQGPGRRPRVLHRPPRAPGGQGRLARGAGVVACRRETSTFPSRCRRRSGLPRWPTAAPAGSRRRSSRRRCGTAPPASRRSPGGARLRPSSSSWAGWGWRTRRRGPWRSRYGCGHRARLVGHGRSRCAHALQVLSRRAACHAHQKQYAEALDDFGTLLGIYEGIGDEERAAAVRADMARVRGLLDE